MKYYQIYGRYTGSESSQVLAGGQVMLVAASFTSKAHKAGILAVTVMAHVGNTPRLV